MVFRATMRQPRAIKEWTDPARPGVTAKTEDDSNIRLTCQLPGVGTREYVLPVAILPDIIDALSVIAGDSAVAAVIQKGSA